MLAVLHPGAMGAAVAACLVGRGHEVGWLRTGRSESTLRRAAQPGLTPFDDLDELLAHTDIVFSICPPHGALEVARQLAGFGGIVLDANAISPETSVLVARIVTGGGARYVDGGIIGPPPITTGTTRLYLAGDDGEVANLFAGSALDVVSLTGAPPAASALKMTYAAWTKTTAALLVSIRRTAAAYEVDDDLVNEWAISQPHLAGAWLHARQQTHEKGWRWSYELAEVGKTFRAVGQPEGFGAAASQVFAVSVDNIHRAPIRKTPHDHRQAQPTYVCRFETTESGEVACSTPPTRRRTQYAAAFGATGIRVNSMDDFGHALKQSLSDTGITIIDLPVDYSRNTDLAAQLHDGVLD